MLGKNDMLFNELGLDDLEGARHSFAKSDPRYMQMQFLLPSWPSLEATCFTQSSVHDEIQCKSLWHRKLILQCTKNIVDSFPNTTTMQSWNSFFQEVLKGC